MKSNPYPYVIVEGDSIARSICYALIRLKVGTWMAALDGSYLSNNENNPLCISHRLASLMETRVRAGVVRPDFAPFNVMLVIVGANNIGFENDSQCRLLTYVKRVRAHGLKVIVATTHLKMGFKLSDGRPVDQEMDTRAARFNRDVMDSFIMQNDYPVLPLHQLFSSGADPGIAADLCHLTPLGADRAAKAVLRILAGKHPLTLWQRFTLQ
jgi:hypothetical protein